MTIRSFQASLWAFCALLAAADGGRMQAEEVGSPLSPEESVRRIRVADDLSLEIAAAEPAVIDPVAIRFDETGRMWVVEMRDYPTGPKPGEKPQSRIRVLEDRDGDGRFEKSVIFAEHLIFPTGLQPWRGGVFVTLSGRLAYMKDTDGDGRADIDETWYTGFAEQNTQLRANHPRLSPDGKIYVANGLKGGRIVDPRRPEQPPVAINGMDFRFDPLTGRCEAVTGNGQFGLTFDDQGNRFVCSNRNPLSHVVLDNHHLRRAPQVAVPAVMHDAAAAGERSRVFPLSRAWTTSNLHAGQFTAACGVTIYRGDLLPEKFRGQAFTCDPTGNLIHMEKMSPRGGTFTAQPAYDGREFIASPEEWFRPVNLEPGPDGALYVVDMYRAVIEHPEFVPQELKQRPDERWGDDRGRIYRVVPREGTRRLSIGDAFSDEHIVATLSHSNGWHRDTARRLLLEDETRRLRLKEALLEACKKPIAGVTPLAARAIVAQFTPDEQLAATVGGWDLNDAAGLQQALRLIDRLDDQAKQSAECRAIFERAEASADGAVQFRALLARPAPADNLAALVTAADRAGDDPWQRTAVLLAAGQAQSLLFERLLSLPGEHSPQLMRELAKLDGRHGEAGLPERLAQVATRGEAASSIADLETAAAFLQGVAQRPGGLAGVRNDETDRALAPLMKTAARLANDDKQPEDIRRAALDLLAFAPAERATVLSLARGNHPQALRAVAVASLAALPGDEGWSELLAAVPQTPPALRRVILDKALSTPTRAGLLIAALEANVIHVAELDPALAARLAPAAGDEGKARAAKLLAAAVPADRTEALAKYQVAATAAGDALRGGAVFQKNCATCHKIGEIGVNVAPDISDTRTKTAAQLLTDILQPNRAIDANYIAYAALLHDGNVVSGVIAAETATSLTIKQPGGKSAVLLREEIAELKSTGVSLMPEGLERNITLDEMGDLLVFLKNWRYLDGKTPFTKP